MSKWIQITFLMGISLLAGNFSFADECPNGEYWVNSHFRRAYVRYDGTYVSATDVSGHCRKNPRGYEKWHQRLSNERPEFWKYEQEKSKKWTTEEANRIYDAISIFPQVLLDLGKVEIHRMIESVSKGNPASTNMNNVILYDSAFKFKVHAEQILAHELSHILYRNIPAGQKKDFAIASGWEKLKQRSSWRFGSKKPVIESDSRSSIEEDFANHIEHYLFKNKSLEKSSPKAYKWIKGAFGEDFKLQEKK